MDTSGRFFAENVKENSKSFVAVGQDSIDLSYVSTTRRITKNFLSLLLSNVLSQGFILWAIVQLARALGPSAFGAFNFAQVIALYFLYLADFGVQTLGTREVARRRDVGFGGYVGHVLVVRSGLAVLAFLLLVGTTLVVPQIGEVQQLVILFGLIVFPAAVLLEWVFQGTEEMEVVGIGRILRGIVYALLVSLFVQGSGDVGDAAGFYVISMALAALYLVAMYLRRFRMNVRVMDFSMLKGIVIAALPLSIGPIITQVNYNFSTVALGLFEEVSTVGYFSAAYKIVLFFWAFVVVAASNALFPVLARLYRRSVSEFAMYLKQASQVFILFAIPLGVGGTILAPSIMDFLYSGGYDQGTIVLQLSIWTVVLVLYRSALENGLIVSNREKRYFIGLTVSGIITIGSSFLLIPKYHLVGASIAGILSESFLFTFFLLSTKFVRPLHFVWMTLKPLGAALLMGLVLLVLPGHLFLLLAVGIMSYLFFLHLFRVYTVREVLSYAQALLK